MAVSAKEESPSALDRKQVVIDREGHYTCSGISSQRDTQTGIQVYQCRHYPKYSYAVQKEPASHHKGITMYLTFLGWVGSP